PRRGFVAAQLARRRAVRAVHELAARDLERAPAAVERAFADAYRALFHEQVIPLYDASLTGDQVIDAIARAIPPGAHGSLIGIQNIKGTGLDFVYRWVSFGLVHRALEKLASPSADARAEALRELLAHDDYG